MPDACVVCELPCDAHDTLPGAGTVNPVPPATLVSLAGQIQYSWIQRQAPTQMGKEAAGGGN